MRFRWVLALFFMVTLGISESGFTYSYGPACQWIHLVGTVVVPADQDIARPIGLTVTYQGEEMKRPATLVTNFPLPKDSFKIFLAGIDEKIAGVFLIKPMLMFSKEILFRYFAKSADGRWRSDFFESRYVPALIPTVDLPKNRDQSFRCNTEVILDPLLLKPR